MIVSQKSVSPLSERDLRAFTEYKDYPVHMSRLMYSWDSAKNLLTQKESLQILDVGCGTGNITIPLGLLPRVVVDGIDVHEPTLEVARKANTLKNVNFAFSYLQDWDISSYDLVIVSEVLEHIGPYQDFLNYLGQHAKAGTRIVLTIPNGRGPFEISQAPLYLMRKWGLHQFINRVKRLLNKKEPYSINYDTPHVNFFTRKSLYPALAAAGLSVLDHRGLYLFAPVIETYLPFIPLQSIARFEQKLSRYLPLTWCSCWQLTLRKGM